MTYWRQELTWTLFFLKTYYFDRNPSIYYFQNVFLKWHQKKITFRVMEYLIIPFLIWFRNMDIQKLIRSYQYKSPLPLFLSECQFTKTLLTFTIWFSNQVIYCVQLHVSFEKSIQSKICQTKHFYTLNVIEKIFIYGQNHPR